MERLSTTVKFVKTLDLTISMQRRGILKIALGAALFPLESWGTRLFDERSRRIEDWYGRLNERPTLEDYTRRHSRMMRYWPIINSKSEEHGWDPFVLAAQMCVESGGHLYAHSIADARGLMQILPTTAREICGPVSLWHGEANVDCALQVLLHHYERASRLFSVPVQERVDMALGCYFYGGSLLDKIRQHGFDSFWDLTRREGVDQTLHYVPKIRALELMFKGRRPRREYHGGEEEISLRERDLIRAFAHFQIPIPNRLALQKVWPGQRFDAIRRRCHRDEEGDLECHERKHEGLDLTAMAGTPVFPMIVGKVVRVEHNAGNAGNYVCVESTMYYTPDTTGKGAAHVPLRCDYMHLEEMFAREGDLVDFNSVLGTVGRTGVKRSGPHLHLQVYDDRRRMIDPLKLLRYGSYFGQALRNPEAYVPLFERLVLLEKEQRHRWSG